MEPAGRIHFGSRKLQRASMFWTDPAAGPLMVSVPVAHLVDIQIPTHAQMACFQWMRSAKTGSEDAKLALDASESAHRDCRHGIVSVDSRTVGQVERQHRTFTNDRIRTAKYRFSSANKFIDSRGKIMRGPLTWMPEKLPAGLVRTGVSAESVVPARIAVEGFSRKPAVYP